MWYTTRDYYQTRKLDWLKCYAIESQDTHYVLCLITKMYYFPVHIVQWTRKAIYNSSKCRFLIKVFQAIYILQSLDPSFLWEQCVDGLETVIVNRLQQQISEICFPNFQIFTEPICHRNKDYKIITSFSKAVLTS